MKKTKKTNHEEILLFWTEILRDESADLKDRLKVSELLAKALGTFSDIDNSEQKDLLSGMSLEAKLELIEKIRKGD